MDHPVRYLEVGVEGEWVELPIHIDALETVGIQLNREWEAARVALIFCTADYWLPGLMAGLNHTSALKRKSWTEYVLAYFRPDIGLRLGVSFYQCRCQTFDKSREKPLRL